MKETAYARPAVLMHWISALLILGMIPGGMFMVSLPEGDAMKTMLYKGHATIGFVILLLTAARLFWVARNRWPAPPEGIAGAQRFLYLGVHVALYILAALMVLSGSSMLVGSGVMGPWALTPEAIKDIPPRAVHVLGSRLLIVAFVLHFGGVLQHQFMKGDVLSRMGAPWFKGLTRK